MTPETTETTLYSEILTKVLSEDTQFALQTEGETDSKYLERLLNATSKLSDAGWASLSVNAQGWYNDAAASVNAMQPMVPCPGFAGAVAPEPVAPAPVVEGEEKKAAPAPVATGTRANKRGVMQKVRELALVNPQQKVADVINALQAEGFDKISEDTAWICLQEVRNVLKAAETLGMTFVKVDASK